MFGFVINHRFNTGPILSECLDLLLIVPDVRHYTGCDTMLDLQKRSLI